MPFSSVLGASSVIKPGVCTSTTRPSVPYEGQLIYETDTDLILAYNGSSWVAIKYNNLQQVNSYNITAAATQTYTGLSNYDTITILMQNQSFAQESYITIRINGNSGSNYRFGGVYTTSNNSTTPIYIQNTGVFIDSKGSSFQKSGVNYDTWSATHSNWAMLKFTNCRSTGFTYFESISGYRGFFGGASVYVSAQSTGVYEVNEAVSSISLIGSSAFRAAGVVYVYGA